MKVTAAAGSTTTAGGMFFLSNGCCYVAVRGSSSGDAGVLPCLQHGKPAAHLQIRGVGAAAVRLACLLIPPHPPRLRLTLFSSRSSPGITSCEAIPTSGEQLSWRAVSRPI